MNNKVTINSIYPQLDLKNKINKLDRDRLIDTENISMVPDEKGTWG